MRLGYLENIDPAYNDRNGVPVRGIIYGGRDSDTSVPIEEALDWKSGIILKACTLRIRDNLGNHRTRGCPGPSADGQP